MLKGSVLALAFLAGIVSAGSPAVADTPGCPNANLLSGKLITDICWRCLFPIRVAGINIAGGIADIPEKANRSSVCSCQDPLGIPQPGITFGMWEPARLVETVRMPGCLATLGTNVLSNLTDRRQIGTTGHGDNQKGDRGFYHVHTYAFPLLFIMDLFFPQNCVADGYFDFDIMFMTEFDPTWDNDVLSFFQTWEAAAVANPLALAACAADATAAAIRRPLDSLFWCAGSWGGLYPFVGTFSAHGGMPENSSLLAARSIAAGHRRALSWRTMGTDVLCKAKIDPVITKSQYKMSMVFPLPEANDAHVIGETTFRWGEHRTIPSVGEDSIYLVYRWNDCCFR